MLTGCAACCVGIFGCTHSMQIVHLIVFPQKYECPRPETIPFYMFSGQLPAHIIEILTCDTSRPNVTKYRIMHTCGQFIMFYTTILITWQACIHADVRGDKWLGWIIGNTVSLLLWWTLEVAKNSAGILIHKNVFRFVYQELSGYKVFCDLPSKHLLHNTLIVGKILLTYT